MNFYGTRCLVLTAILIVAPLARGRSIAGGNEEGYRRSEVSSASETVSTDGRSTTPDTGNMNDLSFDGIMFSTAATEEGSGLTTNDMLEFTTESHQTERIDSDAVTEEDGTVYTVSYDSKSRRALPIDDAEAKLNNTISQGTRNPSTEMKRLGTETLRNVTETYRPNNETGTYDESVDTRSISEMINRSTSVGALNSSHHADEVYRDRENVTIHNARAIPNEEKGINATEVTTSNEAVETATGWAEENPATETVEQEPTTRQEPTSTESKQEPISVLPKQESMSTEQKHKSGFVELKEKPTIAESTLATAATEVSYDAENVSEATASSGSSQENVSTDAFPSSVTPAIRVQSDKVSFDSSDTINSSSARGVSADGKQVIADLARLLSKQVADARDFCETGSYAQLAGTFVSGLALFVSFVVTMCQLQRLLRNQRALLKALNAPRPVPISQPSTSRPGPSCSIAAENGNSASMPLLIRTRRVPSSPPFGRRSGRHLK